jgi:endonuclease III
MRAFQNAGVRERSTSLHVTLAHLDGMTFDEAADLLNLKPENLKRYVHGHSLPRTMAPRIEMLGEILRNLHRVIRPSATVRWLHTEIPDLDGMTPATALKKRKYEEVLELTKSYTGPVTYT